MPESKANDAFGSGARSDPGAIRIVLETRTLQSESELRGRIQDVLAGREFSVQPLFPDASSGDSELQNFHLLIVEGAETGEFGATPFELAGQLVEAADLVSAEPDMGDAFFREPLNERSPAAAAESVAFWCWADGPEPSDRHWAISAIRADAAWAHSSSLGQPARGAGIVVGQPDTGVSAHAELDASAIDLGLGHDFVDNRPEPIDSLEDHLGPDNPGHGTGTSSVVISSQGGEIIGSAPAATLVPIRAVTSVLIFNGSRIARAIDHARHVGCHVITMSLGGVYSRAIRAAIRRAVSENVIVLAAAGNCVGTVVWPARLPECIAVAGVNIEDRKWIGSCSGGSVDISAPGEFVWRARADLDGNAHDEVSGGQGTSFAVALTAGVAALWLAHHGRENLIAHLGSGETLQDRFRTLVQATARAPAGWDGGAMGAGIVDAEALLKAEIAMGQPLGAGEEAPPAPADNSVEDLIAEVGQAGPGPQGVRPAALAALELPVDVRAEASYQALQAAWRRRVLASDVTAEPQVLEALVSAVPASSRLREVASAAQFRQLHGLLER